MDKLTELFAEARVIEYFYSPASYRDEKPAKGW